MEGISDALTEAIFEIVGEEEEEGETVIDSMCEDVGETVIDALEVAEYVGLDDNETVGLVDVVGRDEGGKHFSMDSFE